VIKAITRNNSSIKKYKTNSLRLFITLFADQMSKKQKKLKNVVNKIKKTDKPSTPDSCRPVKLKLTLHSE
jgi:hypothetical protein